MSTEHRTVGARGLEFDVLQSGPERGPLVVLLHGFPQTATCWRQALTSLAAAGWRAVAINQRGYSAGARPDEVDAYRLSELAQDVVDIAAELGAERFHVIGHDWGGTVAWALAGAEPKRVLTLTSLATPHSAALARALRGVQQRARMSYIPVLQLPFLVEALFQTAGGVLVEQALVATGLPRPLAQRDVAAIRRTGPTGPLNWYRALRAGERHVEHVAAPTLYVWASEDVAFGREAAESTAEYVDAPYHFVELTGASHWIPDLYWADVEDLVIDHLGTARTTRRAASRRPARRS